MSDSNCEKCSFRAKYDNNPRSILGRIWRWHIKFCPGWKRYMGSLGEEEKREIMMKYSIER